ncbi:MAG: invasion associated locus B family protein [Rhodobacteraceae bacterium]|nr:invasion associated locus B family protein [Paracoccaceae bacterium]
MHALTKAALVALPLAAPVAAVAQEEQRETFGDWVLVCDGGQPCRLIQQQTERETGDLAVRMIALKVDGGAVLAAQMPMGVHLPSGAVYRLEVPEDEPQRQMVWQRCMDDICEAAIQLDERELELFGENDAILFAYRLTPQDEPRIMQVSLGGFLDGLERTGE